MRSRLSPFLLPFVLLLTAPGLVLAQPVSDANKAAARQLVLDGNDALTKNDFAGAADLFSRADKLVHAPTVTVGLARAQVGLGKLLAAQELYNQLTHETLPPNAPAAFQRAIDDASKELAVLAPRIPSVVVKVSGADAFRVFLDGVEVPTELVGVKRPLDPGAHKIRAVASHKLPAEKNFAVGEGKVETVTLELAPAPPGTPDPPELGAPPPPLASGPRLGGEAAPPPASPAPWRKPTGIALVTVGGASLVVGAVTAAVTASDRSSLYQKCPGGHCSPDLQPTLGGQVNAMHTMADVSTATFIAGGVLAAGGLVVLLTGPKSPPTTGGLSPVIAPGFAGVRGSFQ
jgi:hypothetical protein